ncbi:hypothetical protein [Halomonas salifodinae]
MKPKVRTDAPIELEIEAWYRGAWHRAMTLRLEALPERLAGMGLV